MADYSIWCTVERIGPGVHAALVVAAPAGGLHDNKPPDHEVSFHESHAQAVQWCASQTARMEERVTKRGDSVVKREMVG